MVDAIDLRCGIIWSRTNLSTKEVSINFLIPTRTPDCSGNRCEAKELQKNDFMSDARSYIKPNFCVILQITLQRKAG